MSEFNRFSFLIYILFLLSLFFTQYKYIIHINTYTISILLSRVQSRRPSWGGLQAVFGSPAARAAAAVHSCEPWPAPQRGCGDVDDHGRAGGHGCGPMLTWSQSQSLGGCVCVPTWSNCCGCGYDHVRQWKL